MAKGRRDAGREMFWREVIGRQAASGLGVRAFCRREKLTESAFHWWRRTIARRDAQARPPKPPAFLPVVVENPQQQPQEAITIELAVRRVLRLPGSMPAGRLAEVVQALEAGWADGGGKR
jgi:transposase